ncbi:MAG TPA: hypothetical protein VLC71_09445 [Thermomonas sp.]|nr:hypothetical protein [Thermomonas sp.]
MKAITLCFALGCAAAAPAAAADDTASTEVVAFNATVRVEVDAAGKPVRVEAPADLPEAIRAFVEKRVASWQYTPAQVAGVPQSAVTYVGVNACAVPAGTGYRLGVDFAGNGPRTAADRKLEPPMYPRLAQRSGTEAEFVLILGIEADGHVVIDQIERADISGRPGAGAFEPLLRQWIKTVRFDPEHVAGRPVRGQVRMPVEFSMRAPGDRDALREELQIQAKISRECQIAAGTNDMKPVAVESVVTVIPQPAG